jgi:hypothetical protein
MEDAEKLCAIPSTLSGVTLHGGAPDSKVFLKLFQAVLEIRHGYCPSAESMSPRFDFPSSRKANDCTSTANSTRRTENGVAILTACCSGTH